MRIAFYTPFKPLNHPHPSGDLVIAQGLYQYFDGRGHRLWQAGPLRTRWIYWKPWYLAGIIAQYQRARRKIQQKRIDVWITYHTYYKAPDVLGPLVAKKQRIPYVIFQGIYSTKRRKRLKTWPGFLLNQTALQSAAHVFSNRNEDWTNLRRIIPEDRLTYIRPGIRPQAFRRDDQARTELRRSWGVGDAPVVLTAAMFRPDVKTQGLAWMIRSCGRLFRQGISFHLVIAGDGRERQHLERLAHRYLPHRVRFTGKIPREQMYRFYSAGDVFAFPGIRESLGMVFLESQSCGLPVVAFRNGGIPEVVENGKTGFLTPLYAEKAFDNALNHLISSRPLRKEMGAAAMMHVRAHHDLEKNYAAIDMHLKKIVEGTYHAG
jgi:glycosyltransferase involved in cell wall biosynthesis